MPDELTTAQRAPAPAAVDVAERIAALRHAAEEWGATTHERWLDRLDAAERALCDEVDRLRAEVAALRADKARLDWLEQQERDGLLWVHGPTGAEGEWLVTRRRGVDYCARTLRAAVDAACAAEEGR